MRSRRILLLWALAMLVCPGGLCLLEGCAVHTPGADAGRGDVVQREVPPPDGLWRPHQLRRCAGSDRDLLSPNARGILSTAHELFLMGEGGDAVIELELHLADKPQGEGLVLLTLGLLYVLAGQGEPTVQPREGPAAVTGDWSVDRPRLLARAEAVLREAGLQRPDDAVVDYLLADAARGRGEMDAATDLVARGLGKCTLAASTDVLVRYRGLGPHPARQTGDVALEYPAAAARDGISGEVVLDLLVAPTGRVVQVALVTSPDRRLGKAAADALERADFEPGRIGKYPVWSWTRVTVAFR